MKTEHEVQAKKLRYVNNVKFAYQELRIWNSKIEVWVKITKETRIIQEIVGLYAWLRLKPLSDLVRHLEAIYGEVEIYSIDDCNSRVWPICELPLAEMITHVRNEPTTKTVEENRRRIVSRTSDAEAINFKVLPGRNVRECKDESSLKVG